MSKQYINSQWRAKSVFHSKMGRNFWELLKNFIMMKYKSQRSMNHKQWPRSQIDQGTNQHFFLTDDFSLSADNWYQIQQQFCDIIK